MDKCWAVDNSTIVIFLFINSAFSYRNEWWEEKLMFATAALF